REPNQHDRICFPTRRSSDLIEQQIFDITNVIRDRNQLKRLQWNQELGRIAYEHSKDMFENDYFSHDSPDFGTLTNRLESNDISRSEEHTSELQSRENIVCRL